MHGVEKANESTYENLMRYLQFQPELDSQVITFLMMTKEGTINDNNILEFIK